MGQVYKKDNLALHFEAIWYRYPNKIEKKQALRHFRAFVKTDKDRGNISKALDNYVNSQRVKKGFIQNGSTWFNNWKDWIDYKEDYCEKCQNTGKYVSDRGYDMRLFSREEKIGKPIDDGD